MAREEVDLDFKFSNEELGNFLHNFADKIQDGKVGLSFKGREELEIEPTEKNKVDLDFYETSDHKQLELQIRLTEEIETTDEGRRKIQVEIV
jgi:amphi-Trp domain-containing protein